MALSQLPAFMAAIRRLESGSFEGNYMAIGPPTERYGVARGAYQIMSANWAGWAAQAGIAGADWRNREAQDHVAEFKFREYYEKYGDWRLVAIAWFGGGGAADQARRAGIGSLSGKTDVIGRVDIPEYADLIADHMVSEDNPWANVTTNDTSADDRLAQRTGGKATDKADPFGQVWDSNQTLDDYLLGQEAFGTPITPETEKDVMRSRLIHMVNSMSNIVAGGNREALASVPQRELLGDTSDEMVDSAYDRAREGGV